MKLKLDMSCHLLNAYTKFQIDISKHVEKKSGKLGRTDGRTDGQTDGHCHSIIRPFFKRAYKNEITLYLQQKLIFTTTWGTDWWLITYQFQTELLFPTLTLKTKYSTTINTKLYYIIGREMPNSDQFWGKNLTKGLRADLQETLGTQSGGFNLSKMAKILQAIRF